MNNLQANSLTQKSPEHSEMTKIGSNLDCSLSSSELNMQILHWPKSRFWFFLLINKLALCSNFALILLTDEIIFSTNIDIAAAIK